MFCSFVGNWHQLFIISTSSNEYGSKAIPNVQLTVCSKVIYEERPCGWQSMRAQINLLELIRVYVRLELEYV